MRWISGVTFGVQNKIFDLMIIILDKFVVPSLTVLRPPLPR